MHRAPKIGLFWLKFSPMTPRWEERRTMKASNLFGRLEVNCFEPGLRRRAKDALSVALHMRVALARD